ncbi:MAG: RNA polymerase sigma factor [Sandaracinaceae bacterium]
MSAVGTTWTRLELALADREGDGEPADLESRALTGDARAWDALIRVHQRRVLVALLARGIRLDRARDLCQEAWARLIAQSRAGRLRSLTLPGLAVRQAIFLAQEDARRACNKKPHVDCEMQVERVEPPFTERLHDRDRLTKAQRVLQTCSPSAQRVFELLYADPGMRHAEVADELGLSLQRVRQIVCEVRKVLRAELEVDP